jgi:lysosomal acid lipase/cholesteryl ester hydrolase
MDSAAGMCCNGPTSLAFVLADAGFDVWMNNNRGTTYSRKHSSLDPDTDKEYWDYSFQEMGRYDQPAVWSFIL